MQSRELKTGIVVNPRPRCVEPLDMDRPQRKKVKMYSVGDYVEIWSLNCQSWIKDGEVTETVDGKCIRDGVKLRAGSMKVVYMDGERFKWVPPQLAEEHL